MQLLYIFILTLFTSISANAQVDSATETEPYEYDTTLSGGYKIMFSTDDSLQYLYLKKGNDKIAELAVTSKGLLHKNLGYVGADFKDYFVLVQSYGSGNPNYIELIKKSTGSNILAASAAWIDADQQKETLLYCNDDHPTIKSKMILYNVTTGKKQFFSFPAGIFNEPDILSRIRIKKLTNKHLIIEYDTANGAGIKTYNR